MSIIYCERHDLRWDSDYKTECPRCEDELQECPDCHGTGKVPFIQDNPAEMDYGFAIEATCGRCGGEGVAR